MRHSPRCLSTILALVLSIGLALGCGCGGGDGPQREVVLYSSADQQFAEILIEEFERMSGIDVQFRGDTEATKTLGLVQRLREEADRPVADVFWSSEVFHTVRLAEEGVLAPYESEGTKDWPETFRDPQGRWYGFGLRMRVLAYNTNRVAEADVPRTLEDLLDPAWRGRVVMADPEFGTTSGHVASWFVWYGPQRAREILEGLEANEIRLASGNSTAVRMVAAGEADVCLTDTDDVYSAQREGWPVAMVFLGHGDGGALAIPNTAALVEGGGHPETARELMAFLLSPKAERLLAESTSHNTPIHESVAKDFPAYAPPKCLPIDYEKVADAIPEAIRLATEILR